MKLARTFYAQKTLWVARALLGKYVVVRNSKFKSQNSKLVGRIVETEAYIGPEDKASHASWRKRVTCAPMWAEPGHAYVYFTYGLHWLFNVVTERQGYPAAVLVRALAPVEGADEMARNRRLVSSIKYQEEAGSFRHRPLILDPGYLRLTSGPARLTQALGLDGSFNDEDLVTSARVWIEDRGEEIPKNKIQMAKRIGVDYAGSYKNKLWRFYLKESPFVSRK